MNVLILNEPKALIPSPENALTLSAAKRVIPSQEEAVILSAANAVIPSEEKAVIASQENALVLSAAKAVVPSQENAVILSASGSPARLLAGVKAKDLRIPSPRSRLPRTATTALLTTALLTAGCHTTPAPTPLDQLTAQQRQGYEVFQSHCAVCHNERTADAKHGPALRGLYKKPFLPSGAPANDERITATVLHGHGLMPAQPNLDPEDLAALLAYLHTV